MSHDAPKANASEADGATADGGAGSPSSPFGVPLFRAVWIANSCSNIGTLVQAVGASWLMTSLGASSSTVALVQTANTLPIMLLALWAGAIADNLDRRRVMLICQTFNLLVAAALAVAAWYGRIDPAVLIAATFLIGCGSAVSGPAWQASVGDMVPRAVLPGAIAYNGMGFNVARSLGPAIGGVVVAAAGAATAFLLNAASYLGLIVVLARWKTEPHPQRGPRERLGHAMADGVRFVGLSPSILRIMLRAALFGSAASAMPALMPLVARQTLHGDALIYGLLLGAFGVGSVAGAMIGVRARAKYPPETTMRLATAAITAGVIVTAMSDSIPVTVAALPIAGAGWVLALSTFNVMVQLASPRWVVARVIALYQMCSFGGMALGSWLFGSVAADHGVGFALLVAAGLQAVGGVVGLIAPLPAINGRDLSPREGWRKPDTAIPVDDRAGPIVVTVESRVATDHVGPFLAAMEERRRIRMRNGARRWTLMRDLADETRWLERFHFATWADYVRYNERVTKADHANVELLASLRMEGTDHKVGRWLAQSASTRHAPSAPNAAMGHAADTGAALAP